MSLSYRRCSSPGPGIGEDGEPDGDGANCDFLGNVIIVQESYENHEIPEVNGNGGNITFDFPFPGGQYVFEIGLLDIKYATKVLVLCEAEAGVFSEHEMDVPLLGDNSVQTIQINKANVKWIRVMMTRSGAVTFVKFCPKDIAPKVAPAEAPQYAPVSLIASPTASPAVSPVITPSALLTAPMKEPFEHTLSMPSPVIPTPRPTLIAMPSKSPSATTPPSKLPAATPSMPSLIVPTPKTTITAVESPSGLTMPPTE